MKNSENFFYQRQLKYFIFFKCGENNDETEMKSRGHLRSSQPTKLCVRFKYAALPLLERLLLYKMYIFVKRNDKINLIHHVSPSRSKSSCLENWPTTVQLLILIYFKEM